MTWRSRYEMQWVSHNSEQIRRCRAWSSDSPGGMGEWNHARVCRRGRDQRIGSVDERCSEDGRVIRAVHDATPADAASAAPVEGISR